MIHHYNHETLVVLVLFTVSFYHFSFSRYLELAKRHFWSDILVPFPDSGVLYSHEVFMKNSWIFHWWSCWFRLWNFHQQGVSHNFTEFAGVKACFLEVTKVTYLRISVFFRKVYSYSGQNKGKIFDRASIY